MKTSETRKVLVTGATGFVGRYMVRELLTRKYQVVCFVRTGDSVEILDGLDVRIERGDIRDLKSVSNAVANVDVVVHLAAILGIPDPKINFEVNLEGTRHIIEACKTHGIKKIIAFSSISASREKTSAYGISKKEAEKLLSESGLDVTIFRTEMIYGNGSRGLKKIIGQVTAFPFIIPMVGRGDIQRQPLFVHDIVNLTANVIKNGRNSNGLYEVAGKERICLREFVEMVASELGVKKWIFPIPVFMALGIARAMELLFKNPPFTYDNMLGLTMSMRMNTKPVYEKLGFMSTSLRQGLHNSIQEIKGNPS